MDNLNLVHLYDFLKIPGTKISVMRGGVLCLTFPNDQNMLQSKIIYIGLAEDYECIVNVAMEMSILFLRYDEDMVIDQASVYPFLNNGTFTGAEINIRGRQLRENGLCGARGNLKIKLTINDVDITDLNIPIFAVGTKYQDVVDCY